MRIILFTCLLSLFLVNTIPTQAQTLGFEDCSVADLGLSGEIFAILEGSPELPGQPLVLIDLATNCSIRISENAERSKPKYRPTIDFSPDGRYLAFTTDRSRFGGNALDIYYLETGQYILQDKGFLSSDRLAGMELDSTNGDEIESISWSPDGSRLAFNIRRQHIAIITPTGELVQRSDAIDVSGRLIWSQDGQNIISDNSYGNFKILNTATLTRETTLSVEEIGWTESIIPFEQQTSLLILPDEQWILGDFSETYIVSATDNRVGVGCILTGVSSAFVWSPLMTQYDFPAKLHTRIHKPRATPILIHKSF